MRFKASDEALASDIELGTRTKFLTRQLRVKSHLIFCDCQSGPAIPCTLKNYRFNWLAGCETAPGIQAQA